MGKCCELIRIDFPKNSKWILIWMLFGGFAYFLGGLPLDPHTPAEGIDDQRNDHDNDIHLRYHYLHVGCFFFFVNIYFTSHGVDVSWLLYFPFDWFFSSSSSIFRRSVRWWCLIYDRVNFCLIINFYWFSIQRMRPCWRW